MRILGFSLATYLVCAGCSAESPAPADASVVDGGDSGDAALCLPLTQMSRCGGINCGVGSYCTDVTQGPSPSALCNFLKQSACTTCASCGCVTVPSGCTCSETSFNGVVIDCRK